MSEASHVTRTAGEARQPIWPQVVMWWMRTRGRLTRAYFVTRLWTLRAWRVTRLVYRVTRRVLRVLLMVNMQVPEWSAFLAIMYGLGIWITLLRK